MKTKYAPRILVIGSINTDLVGTGKRLPLPGETLHGYSFSTSFGGKGANQAVAAARAGAQVELIGAVGDDEFGRTALDALQGYGVDTALCRTLQATSTGVALIMIGEDAENSILIIPGANGSITPDWLTAIEWSQYDAVILQLEIPFETIEATIQQASPHTKVILTPAPASPLPDHLLRQVDVLIPNEHELKIAAGADGFDAAAEKAARLTRMGTAVTLGANGVRWISRTADVAIPAFPCNPVDTVGAGDCFSGYLAAALAEGHPVRESLIIASAAAALKIQRHGAQTGIPLREEVDSFLQSY
jgi:ribokinase